MSIFSRLPLPRKALLLTTIGLCSATSFYASTTIREAREAQQNPHAWPPNSTLARRTDTVMSSLVLSDRNIREGRTYTLLSHTLTHFSLTHFAANMFGLWSFGGLSLVLFGPWAFAGLWVGAGITGGATAVIWERMKKRDGWVDPRGAGEHFYLGASGSVLGIVTAVALSVPKGSIWLFPIPFPIKHYMMIPGFVAYSYFAEKNGWKAGTGHLAHLGGMASGALAWLLFLRRLPFQALRSPFNKF